jgi:hypothetical protein
LFDFRYHALSLTAVFVALALGLLLGVAIGDSGLVSSADRNLRKSLRADVRRANDRADAAARDRDRYKRYADAAYPLLTRDRLSGQSVGLVFIGGSSSAIDDNVKDALRGTGAALRSVAVMDEPLDLSDAARRAKGTRYETLDANSDKPDLDLVSKFGFRMGVQYATPGKLLSKERGAVFDVFNGKLDTLGGIVIAYNPKKLDQPAADVRDSFEQGFVAGLRDTQIPVVGVELKGSDPSHVPWFQDRKVSSVDNVDEVVGRAALVFALLGAQGQFGERDGATLLPDFTP